MIDSINKTSVVFNKSTNMIEFPVYHVRGGTSTGLIIWEHDAPEDLECREELLRRLMGVPLAGDIANNNQITGLGRMLPTSNKVFFVRVEKQSDGIKVISTLAQLSADHAKIDWSVNCGNMSSAIPLWALDQGLLTGKDYPQFEIYNTNTKSSMLARINYSAKHGFDLIDIPGVNGAFPSVDLFLQNPIGAKTGKLLPTGNAQDMIENVPVSCVDVSVPMVIIKAQDLGKTGKESISELSNDTQFLSTIKSIWVAAGQKMGLRHRDGHLMTAEELQQSETIPKLCIVSAPSAANANIAVRYFTPQKAHSSMAVTGGCCLAAACLIEGSVAAEVAANINLPESGNGETKVFIENPAGILETLISHESEDNHLVIKTAAYSRSAQILMKGVAPIVSPSPKLLASFNK